MGHRILEMAMRDQSALTCVRNSLLLQLGLLLRPFLQAEPETRQSREEPPELARLGLLLDALRMADFATRIVRFHRTDWLEGALPVLRRWRFRAATTVAVAVGPAVVLASRLTVEGLEPEPYVQMGVLVLDAVAVDVGLDDGAILVLLDELAACGREGRDENKPWGPPWSRWSFGYEWGRPFGSSSTIVSKRRSVRFKLKTPCGKW